MPKPGSGLPNPADVAEGSELDPIEPEGGAEGGAEGGEGGGEGGQEGGSAAAKPPVGATGQPAQGQPAGGQQPPRNLPSNVPYSRFAETNRQLQEFKKKAADFQAKEQRLQTLEEQEQFLSSYFKTHPEEYKRMVAIHEGRKDELEGAQQQAQAQLDATGEINPALAKQIQKLTAQTLKTQQALEAFQNKQVEDQQAQQHYDQFRIDLNEFQSDPKYAAFKEDKKMLSWAIGMTRSNKKSLKENLTELADHLLARDNSNLKNMAQVTQRRKGAKVETGGGSNGNQPKPQPKFGTEDHLAEIIKSYD